MAQERSLCDGCGEHSSPDDLIHNALYAGIHSASFMMDLVLLGVPNRLILVGSNGTT